MKRLLGLIPFLLFVAMLAQFPMHRTSSLLAILMFGYLAIGTGQLSRLSLEQRQSYGGLADVVVWFMAFDRWTDSSDSTVLLLSMLVLLLRFGLTRWAAENVEAAKPPSAASPH